MAKHIRSLMLRNYSSVLVMLMARIAVYEDGIGIQNASGKTIGWIDILTEDETLRAEHFKRTAMILNDIVNDPKHAVQPDWSYLDEGVVSAPLESAVMPTRSKKKLDLASEAQSV
ncbi:hypothetical protein [Propionivibrio sp.]|uniref:hypothetical protein n=1 Tax=Propionivibrio sp. TaxID=2212460 RepID=UPI002619C50B|nr:hypothetical protein [Propionivibrio sp.]